MSAFVSFVLEDILVVDNSSISPFQKAKGGYKNSRRIAML